MGVLQTRLAQWPRCPLSPHSGCQRALKTTLSNAIHIHVYTQDREGQGEALSLCTARGPMWKWWDVNSKRSKAPVGLLQSSLPGDMLPWPHVCSYFCTWNPVETLELEYHKVTIWRGAWGQSYRPCSLSRKAEGHARSWPPLDSPWSVEITCNQLLNLKFTKWPSIFWTMH